MRELFENYFGIIDLDEEIPGNPFPSTAYSPKRANDWAKRSMIRQLLNLEVPKIAGMSIHALLYDISNGELEAYLDIAKEGEKERAEYRESLEKEFKQLSGETQELVNKFIDDTPRAT